MSLVEIKPDEMLQIIKDVVQEALEAMAFAEIENTEHPKKKDDETFGFCVKIYINEPFEGALHLEYSTPLAEALAGAMYGGQEISPELLRDAMAEMLNTVTGKFLSSYAPKASITIGLPIFTKTANEKNPTNAHIHSTCFVIDGKRMLVDLVIFD